MLVQLVIQDFALIENVELMFGCGLNVLTGETGAGKSIIVDAMNLLVGGRASSSMVRFGAEKALVQGCFDCSSCQQVMEKTAELGLPLGEDNTLLLVSGGMLIPGNIPNIISASKLKITSSEWAKLGIPLGLILLVIYYVILFVII
jgi:energy-coupling factor transporter ATP-binding protein EcfA2